MFSTILLPIDLQASQFTDQAIRLALKGALRASVRLNLLFVIPGDATPTLQPALQQAAMRKEMRQAHSRLAHFAMQQLPDHVSVELSVRIGDPVQQILVHSRAVSADLMILAAHNRNLRDRTLLGSTAAGLVERADCSVVVLRDPLGEWVARAGDSREALAPDPGIRPGGPASVALTPRVDRRDAIPGRVNFKQGACRPSIFQSE